MDVTIIEQLDDFGQVDETVIENFERVTAEPISLIHHHNSSHPPTTTLVLAYSKS